MNNEKRQAILNVRAEYKLKMAKKISWLKSTSEWQNVITKLKYEDYEFIAPHMGYLKQMIRLYNSSYTSGPILMLADIRLLLTESLHGSRIKHLCENGIGVLAVEKKSRRAVAYVMHMDLCDDFYVNAARTVSTPRNSAEIRYVNELMSALHKTVDSVMPSFNDGMWETEEQLREFWGVSTVHTIAFVSPHLKGSGVVAVLSAFIKVVFFEVGYKYLFVSLGHWRTVKMAQTQRVEIIGSVDILNFVFSDGNSVRKLLNKHQKTYFFDDEFMHRMENSLVLKMCCDKKYNSWQSYLSNSIEIFVLYESRKAQMLSKMKSSKISKL